MTPTQNSLLGLLYKEMQGGSNIFSAMDKVSAQYPQMLTPQMVMQAKILLGNNTQETLGQFVKNMAKERGMTLQAAINNVMHTIGISQK